MRLLQNCILASLLVMSMILHKCESSRYSQLSAVDHIIRPFFNEEDRLWSDINTSTSAKSANATLLKLLSYFDENLNQLGRGNIEPVRTVNEELANYLEQMKRVQNEATTWLVDRRYQDAQQNCENIIQSIPREISQIFDVTKSPPFLAYIRDNSDFCQTNKRIVAPGGEDLSLQNVVLDVYTTVAESVVKGYMTSQMAYMILGIKTNPKKYQSKSIEFRQSFTSHYKTLESNVRSIIQNFTGEIWNCDDFSKDFSYTEITKFIQGYIDNEVNFNRDGTCRKQCSDYHQVDYHVCRNNTLCIMNYLDTDKTRCDGQIRACEFIESDMVMCPNENDRLPNRRYNYVRYSNGLMLGKPQYCGYEVKLKSWVRWFVSCSYCFCYCDHEGPLSDRYFSLRESISNIAENKVVTGIRLMKKSRIIHIFISERKLLPAGKVEVGNQLANDTTWVSDYNFVIEDSGVTEGIDYHTLTWKDRSIELDTIRVPKDEVVTGARFRVINNRLRFEIRSTPFNRETGYLIQEPMRTVWRSNNYQNKEKIPIEGSDVPTLSPEKSKRHRLINKYIEFTPTDIYKDIAQTTVPFIDTQPVEARIAQPLIGAGIYYKSTPLYGGYIGPLIVLHNSDD